MPHKIDIIVFNCHLTLSKATIDKNNKKQALCIIPSCESDFFFLSSPEKIKIIRHHTCSCTDEVCLKHYKYLNLTAFIGKFVQGSEMCQTDLL